MSPILYAVISLIAMFVFVFCAYLSLGLSEKDELGIVVKSLFGAAFWISIIIAATSLMIFIWALCQLAGG